MKFYQDYKDRKAKRYYLSEKVPEENKDLVLVKISYNETQLIESCWRYIQERSPRC